MTAALEPTAASGADDSRPARGISRRALAGALEHPVLTALITAIAARTMFALLAAIISPGYLIPDEQQYVDLAHTVADGQPADSWAPVYGQSLYDSTRVFTGLLVAIFHVTGASRAAAIVPVILFGGLVAAATTRLALELLSKAYALGAGLLVALLPSQVLWSSVVLRESAIWLGLVTTALLVALAVRQSSLLRLGLGLLGVSGCLLALASLRDQTMVVATWALLAVALLVPWRRRIVGPTAAALLVVALPWLGGLGIAGYGLVQVAVPSLATTRTSLSLGAGSSFVDQRPLVAPTAAPSSGASDDSGAAPRHVSRGLPGEGPLVTDGAGGSRVVAGPEGTSYVVDETAGGTLSALPRGLVAVNFRPFPWESVDGLGVWFAKVENAAWMVLYALSAVGLLSSWRRRSALGYPVVLMVGLVGVAAVTQGNLGTAFRHRGQWLWVLALLAALGVYDLMERRRKRPAT